MRKNGKRWMALVLTVLLVCAATLTVYAGSNSINGSISSGTYSGTVTSNAYSGYASMWAEPYDSWNEIYVKISGDIFDFSGRSRGSLYDEGGNQCYDSASSNELIQCTSCAYYIEGIFVGNRIAYT